MIPTRTADQPALVLDPGFGFADLARALEADGWSRMGDPFAPEPVLDGEPEFAEWGREGLRLVYAFHPAFHLRTLRIDGDGAAVARLQLLRELPQLTVEALPALLAADTIESILLGIHATRELGAAGLLDQVVERCAHPDPLVAGAAEETVDELAAGIVKEGIHRLSEERARRPGHSVLFPKLPVEDRRQMLRTWMSEGQAVTAGVEEVLRSALGDPDLEVRVTAMLAVGRLGARAVLREAANVDLQGGSRRAFSDEDHQFLLSAREVVTARLGNPSEAGRQLLATPFARRILGETRPGEDRLARLLHRLTKPEDSEN